MKTETGNILEWVQTKKSILSNFSKVATDTAGIELTHDQALIVNSKIDQLREIENVIIEFMEEQNDMENGNV